MLGWRVKNRGLIHNFAHGNGLVQAYDQLFQQLCQALPEAGQRFCVVASAGAGEGRSTSAINLATVAAHETDSAVLLLDADTASPSLHKPFRLSAGPGLSEVLAGEVELSEAIRPVKDHGFQVLTCGDRPVGTVTLAESERVGEVLKELRSRFGWMVADSAPLLTTPGMARFARRADGVLLAVRWSKTRSQLVRQAAEHLDAAGAKPLGVVLTQRHYLIPNYVYRRL